MSRLLARSMRSGRGTTASTSEYRIFGPPGTGKTTNLSRQIRRAAERYGPESVLVTSFSRTAAAELAGRDLPISPDRIGTLHSHWLPRPRIASYCGNHAWRSGTAKTRAWRSHPSRSRANSTAIMPVPKMAPN